MINSLSFVLLGFLLGYCIALRQCKKVIDNLKEKVIPDDGIRNVSKAD